MGLLVTEALPKPCGSKKEDLCSFSSPCSFLLIGFTNIRVSKRTGKQIQSRNENWNCLRNYWSGRRKQNRSYNIDIFNARLREWENLLNSDVDFDVPIMVLGTRPESAGNRRKKAND